MGQAGCSTAPTAGGPTPGTPGTGTPGTGDEQDPCGPTVADGPPLHIEVTDDPDSCDGALDCTGSALAGFAQGAWTGLRDEATGTWSLITDPGQLVDAGKAIRDDPLNAAKQLVWDDESAKMADQGDTAGADSTNARPTSTANGSPTGTASNRSSPRWNTSRHKPPRSCSARNQTHRPPQAPEGADQAQVGGQIGHEKCGTSGPVVGSGRFLAIVVSAPSRTSGCEVTCCMSSGGRACCLGLCCHERTPAATGCPSTSTCPRRRTRQPRRPSPRWPRRPRRSCTSTRRTQQPGPTGRQRWLSRRKCGSAGENVEAFVG